MTPTDLWTYITHKTYERRMTPTEKPRQRFNPIDDDPLEYRHHVSVLPATEDNHRAAVEELFAAEQAAQAQAKADNQRGRLPTKRKKRWRR